MDLGVKVKGFGKGVEIGYGFRLVVKEDVDDKKGDVI